MSIGHRPRIDATIIDALLARPQGLTVAEGSAACPQTGPRAMTKRLQLRVAYGKAWSIKVPGSLAHRFFASPAALAAWSAANPPMPTRRDARVQRQQARPARQVDKLMALVIERGASGTLPADLSAHIGRPSGYFGSWVTDMKERGRLDYVKHRGVRIVHPVGVPISPQALQACIRRIDVEFATRNRRSKYTVVPGKPGLPAGVTIPAKGDWRNAKASNDGQVQPTICPAPKFDHRYQVDPATVVAGGFASLRPGQYDMPASNMAAQVLAKKRAA